MRGLVLIFGLHAGDHWFGTDKIKHFFLSAFVESVTYSALRASNVRHDPSSPRRRSRSVSESARKFTIIMHTGFSV